MRGILRVWVRSVVSLYEIAKTRDRVDSEWLEELEGEVGMRQDAMA